MSVSKNLLSVASMFKFVVIESLYVAQRVLLIDMDLEAIGKDFMFVQNKEKKLNLSLKFLGKESL